jgi:hypothetical protein
MADAGSRISELERFSARSRELLIRDGWMVDEDGPSYDGNVFLGSFVKPTSPDFVATIEFILESGPAVHGFPGGNRLRAVVGGEFGVRHLPTATRLRGLNARLGCDTNISLDIQDLFDDRGLDLPTIEDDRSADEAASRLADASARYGEPFAREHSSLDAMITFVEAGRQTTRDELFQAIFVPVAMSAGGRDAEAREAVARYQSGLTHDDDRRQYQTFIQQFLP